MTVDVRPAATRFHTRLGWLDPRHSFGFGHGHGHVFVAVGDAARLTDAGARTLTAGPDGAEVPVRETS